MASQYTVETKHDDMIHDAQFDYYGRSLATCSSDRTIRIFDVTGEQRTLTAELRGHEGAVWEISWAHPKFGNVLASCSYDRTVRVWREQAKNEWVSVYVYSQSDLSVNSLSWAPQEYGLVLACASSDGSVSVLTHKEGGDKWDVQRFVAHSAGVNSISWCPPSLSLSSADAAPLLRRLATGGSDNVVKIFSFSEEKREWECDEKDNLEAHVDWVRDVSFAPSVGLPTTTLASCSQDGTVLIWTQDDASAGWQKKTLPRFPGPVWRVSWSVSGNILAISSGDNKVTLWKEGVDGEWTCLSTLTE